MPFDRICLDAGHGMSNRTPGRFDPGAVAGGVREADVALDWALAIRWVGLNWFGIRPGMVVMTRDDHSDHTPVARRDDFAKARDCTHFLSLHCNASGNPLIRGTETFYSEDKGMMASVRFATKVQAAAMGAVGSKDRGLRSERKSQHGDLAVFGLAGEMVSALLEIGYVTNGADRSRMLSREARIWFAVKFWRDVMGFRVMSGPWKEAEE